MRCIFCLEEISPESSEIESSGMDSQLTCSKHTYAVGSVWVKELSCFCFLGARFVPRPRSVSLSWMERDDTITENNPLRYTCYICNKVSKGPESGHNERCRRAALLRLGYNS